MYSNSTFSSKSRTTPNAGIHSTKTVFHGFSKSDPPNPWASSTYDSKSKETFDTTLFHARSNSASAVSSSLHKSTFCPPTGTIITAREGRAARSKVLAPPSSFHSSAGSTFIPSTEPYRSATVMYSRQPTSSISSMSFGGPINSRPNASRPRTADGTPGLARCNTSTNSGGMLSESSASQRINVKSLMSKPTAIPFDRAQSVQSNRPSETEDSDSSDDPHTRRTHSLEILRKTNRRSKSVDLFVKEGRNLSSTIQKTTHGDLFENVKTKKGPIASSSSVNLGLVSGLARSPSSPGTARPSNVSDWREGDRARRKAPATAKQSLDTNVIVAAIDDPSQSYPLTPASAIALAWTESQKRTAFVSPTVSKPDPKPSQQPVTAVQTSNCGNNIPNTSEDDPFLTWKMAERIYTPAPIPNDSVRNNVNEGGVGATMKELSRKVVSVLGRPDKSKEKVKPARAQSTNFLPHEEVSSLAVAKESGPASQPFPDTLKYPLPKSSSCDNRDDHQSRRSSSTKLNGKPQLKIGMAEAGYGGSTSRPNSSFNQFFVSEPVTRDGSATSPRANMQFSQSPSAFPTAFPDQPPSRSTTPNTLKKRSRPHLRHKSSSTTPITPQHVQESVTPKEETVSTTEKLRGLVKKLSGGNLNRRSSSTDRPIRDLNAPSDSGHSHNEVVPPVPPLPKNFEIVDPETYLTEKMRGYDAPGESDNDSAMRGSRSFSQRDISARSSRRSSPVRSIRPSHADSTAAIQFQLSSRRLPRSATDPASSISDSVATSAPRSPFIQPRRAKSRQETEISQSSNGSTRPTGKDANFRGYGSSMLSHSSSEIYSAQNFPSARGDEGRIAVSYDVTTLASIVAQPIMPLNELYRRGEDEAASLRMRQQEPSQSHPVRTRKISRPKQLSSEEDVHGDDTKEIYVSTSPPPAFSPLKTVALTAPPQRKVSKDKMSALVFPPEPRQANPIAVNGHHRSDSTPIYTPPMSPDMPQFSTIDTINFEPLSAGTMNIADQLYSPKEYSRDPRVHSEGRLGSSSTKQPLSPAPSNGKQQFPTSSDSPSEHGDSDSHPPHKKLRVKTSLGTISRVKSVLLRSGSTSHTPSSSTSYNTFTPSSGGMSSGASRTSREHGYHYRTARSRSVVESQMSPTSQASPTPPVPFTSTAFAFKELPTTKLPSAKQLTDGEREDMWNALLNKSEEAGGTLTVVIHDQALESSLSSDNVSFISS